MTPDSLHASNATADPQKSDVYQISSSDISVMHHACSDEPPEKLLEATDHHHCHWGRSTADHLFWINGSNIMSRHRSSNFLQDNCYNWRHPGKRSHRRWILLYGVQRIGIYGKAVKTESTDFIDRRYISSDIGHPFQACSNSPQILLEQLSTFWYWGKYFVLKRPFALHCFFNAVTKAIEINLAGFIMPVCHDSIIELLLMLLDAYFAVFVYHELNALQIRVIDPTTQMWCASYSDPHIRTFDGRWVTAAVSHCFIYFRSYKSRDDYCAVDALWLWYNIHTVYLLLKQN